MNMGEKSTETHDRLTEIRAVLCNGKNKIFAQKINKSPQFASALCNGKSNPGKKMIEEILDAFPQVSRSWLYFGEGEMFAADNSHQHGAVNGNNSGIIVQHGDNSTYHNTPTSNKFTTLADYEAIITSQQQTIERLTKIIETLTSK